MTELDTRPDGRPPVPVPSPQGEPRGNPGRLVALGALVVLAAMAGGWPLLVMIAALIGMIFLHELGHYLTAKWAGMKVTEFFIGFGPRIWSFHRGETEYGLKAIPAGAYVKIIGMNNLDEFDPADADRTYMSKPFWRRLSVAVAGSTMHFLLALVCLLVAHAAVGLPGGQAILTNDEAEELIDSSPWVVAVVSEDSAADAAGIRPGDRILAVDGEQIVGFADFREAVRSRPGDTVPVVVERDGSTSTLEVTIGRNDDDPSQGFFGVGPDPEIETDTIGIVDAVEETGSVFGTAVTGTFEGLGHILSPSGLGDLANRVFAGDDEPAVGGQGGGGGDGSGSSGGGQAVGLVGITDIGRGTIAAGAWGDFLLIFAVVNIFIGVFNLLPLLPLDGGHVVIAVYEKVRSMLQGGRPYHVDVVKLLPVTYAVLVVLVFLGVGLFVTDTRELIGG